MSRSPRAVAVLLAMLAVSGCASHNSGTAPLSADAARILQADTLVLARLSSTQDWVGARSALAALQADLSAARSQGAVSPDRVAALTAQMAAVAAAIPPPVATTPAQATPTPTPTPTNDGKHTDHGGDSNGNGGGGGD